MYFTHSETQSKNKTNADSSAPNDSVIREAKVIPPKDIDERRTGGTKPL